MKSVQLGLFLLGAFVPGLAMASGNGGSYNGPVLNGPSIPVAVDHFVSYSDLQGIVAACMGNLAGDLAEQIYHVAPEPSNPSRVFLHMLPGDCQYSLTDQLDIQTDGSGETVQASLVLSDNFCDPQFQLQASLPSDASSPVLLGFADHSGLPQLQFQSVIADSAYDELGRLVRLDQVTLKDLVLHLPANDGSAVPLMNSTTDHATSITANIERYGECLQSTIEK